MNRRSIASALAAPLRRRDLLRRGGAVLALPALGLCLPAAARAAGEPAASNILSSPETPTFSDHWASYPAPTLAMERGPAGISLRRRLAAPGRLPVGR